MAALVSGSDVPPGGSGSGEEFQDWLVSPVGLLVTNLFLAAFIPLGQLCVWLGHGWRPRWVASVRPGMRWSWLLICAGVTAAVYVPVTGLLLLVDPQGGSPERQAPLLLLVVLLTTPLQAAGEEYLFRGWLTQAIGSLVPRAAVGALVAGGVSATLFALAHGQQDLWLFLDRFGFGVAASWLVWRTGGLEAGIAVHAVNNIVAFVPTILLGQLGEALEVSESSPLTTLVDLVQLAIVVAVVLRLARRRGIARLHDPATQPGGHAAAGRSGPPQYGPPPGYGAQSYYGPPAAYGPPPAYGPQPGHGPPPPGYGPVPGGWPPSLPPPVEAPPGPPERRGDLGAGPDPR